jgi:hypothetical protein
MYHYSQPLAFTFLNKKSALMAKERLYNVTLIKHTSHALNLSFLYDCSLGISLAVRRCLQKTEMASGVYYGPHMAGSLIAG